MFRTGGADLQADAVIVNGTSGNESIRAAGEAFGASVS
jgi:orotidine-5'-phosphate decarboxylase